MANEAIKIICKIGETLSGKLLTINALDNYISIFKIAKQTGAAAIPEPLTDSKPAGDIDHEITIETLNTWLAQDSDQVYLIDVREDFEFEDHNIGGVNISLYELNNHADSFPTGKKLVFVCQTGQRSKMAVQIIKPLYKGEIYTVKNGIA